ncbi:MAG: thiolase family protein [Hyphomicrobiaceae bacterium]|nr:thiolase family protein [Hyphomicrobiaceae bacterium]
MAPLASAYIVAARRSAMGRVGGLHRSRRIEDLASPVVTAALADAGIDANRVEEIVIGNTTQGGNPARIIALAAGLPDATSAITIDRQCASGLDAIVAACRSVAAGEASVAVAGGAEAISTAPWRVAKPKSLFHLPHFIGLEPMADLPAEEAQAFEADERLARRLGIGRTAQDAFALSSHQKAEAARQARRFVGEIVPIRSSPDEARDQGAGTPDTLDDLDDLPPFHQPDGTVTPGNTSALDDGAAIVVIVSSAVWEELGRPPALRLTAVASQGVPSAEAALAPMAAVEKLYGRAEGFNAKDIAAVELGETSAAQAIAFAQHLGLDPELINPDGGEVARGHPLGAAGAVLVVRLFTRMVRARSAGAPPARIGVAALGAIGGMGVSALFEAV